MPSCSTAAMRPRSRDSGPRRSAGRWRPTPTTRTASRSAASASRETNRPSWWSRPRTRRICPVLYFTEVPEPKQGKNRVHLDVVAPQSVDEEVIRLEGIGADAPQLGRGRGSRVGGDARSRGQRVLRDAAGDLRPPRGACLPQNSPTVRPASSMSTLLEGRRPAEPGHPLHVAAQHHHEAGAGARHDGAHRQPESGGAVQHQRVVAERQVRLRHAHRQRAEAQTLHRARGPSRPGAGSRRRRRRTDGSRSPRSARAAVCPRA